MHGKTTIKVIADPRLNIQYRYVTLPFGQEDACRNCLSEYGYRRDLADWKTLNMNRPASRCQHIQQCNCILTKSGGSFLTVWQPGTAF
jgi:hypothetical protein